MSQAFLALIDACPDVLFVTGSGNSNQPDDVLNAVPQTFCRPNLIVVGATAPTADVARAAGAMLAVNPGLRPADLVEGLTGTATDGEGGIRLLHTQAAVAWARRRIR